MDPLFTYTDSMLISYSKYKKLKIDEHYNYLFRRFNIKFETTHHLNILKEECLQKHFLNRITDRLQELWQLATSLSRALSHFKTNLILSIQNLYRYPKQMSIIIW